MTAKIARRARRLDRTTAHGVEPLERRQLMTAVVVNSTSDADAAGTVTLRDAIATANASDTATQITFDAAVFATPQTIVLGGTQLSLTNTAQSTTITGPAGGVTVSGNNASRVLDVAANVTASLDDVSVTAGSTPTGSGAGIYNAGTLTFADAAVTNCTCGSSSVHFGGGGILNANVITLTNATVSGNTANGRGGGLENYGGYTGYASATVTNSTFTQNLNEFEGGGAISSDVDVYAGTTALTLNNDTISDNTTVSDGGGILLDASVTGATITNCTVTGNVAAHWGGGLGNDAGSATIVSSTFAGNSVSTAGASRGGGIQSTGTLTVSDSTLSGNTTPFLGGGLDALGGRVTLTDSTVADNTAGGGGGINDGANATVLMTGVTLAGNTATGGSGVTQGAGGVSVNSTNGGVLMLGNSIVAGNTYAAGSTATAGTTQSDDVQGTATSQGNNLVGTTDGSTGWTAADLTGTAAAPLAAGLGTLADNGGPTLTLLPASDSPVINAGSVALIPSTDTTDQRGQVRTVDGAVDIGAVEVGSTATTPSPTPTPTPTPSPTPTPTATGLTPTVLKSTLATQVVSGTAARRGVVVVTITNSTTATITGTSTVALYATTTGAIDSASALIGSVPKRLKLAAGRSVNVAVPVKSLQLSAGAYTVLPQTTDPAGTVVAAAAGPTVQVAAAFVALSAVIGKVGPTALVAGRPITLTVVVTNAGNVNATGAGSVTVGLSADAGATVAVPITPVKHGVNARAGGRAYALRVRVKVPTTAPAGTYLPIVTVTEANNTATAVGTTAITVG